MNILSSFIGSLTNPTKLSNTFKSAKNTKISSATIGRYLDCFVDAFIISKAFRYDMKGKKYIDSPLKYYFTDVGLRNARLNFRQQEENHIMENILYNGSVQTVFWHSPRPGSRTGYPQGVGHTLAIRHFLHQPGEHKKR